MTHPAPSFSVNVDVTNPGQFFACCGLLELAHRLWPGAEGWFDEAAFNIAVVSPKNQDVTLENLISSLRGIKWVADESRGVKSIYPIHASELNMYIDWWLKPDWYRFGNKPEKLQGGLMSTDLKLWAGNQTSLQIASKLTSALVDIKNMTAADDLLNLTMPLTGRYGFDPRSAWNALDVGFSPNDQSMTVDTYPTVEMFAAIGLQRFRPMNETPGRLAYATWHVPLSPLVAAAAAVPMSPIPFTRCWKFSIVDRGSYKGFDFATPIGDQQ